MQVYNECYSLLLGSGQRANRLAVWRSRNLLSVGPARAPIDWEESDHVTCIFSAQSVPRSYPEDIRRYNAVDRLES
jgi:hypothetical protein